MQGILKAVYFFLGVIMYYFNTEYINLGIHLMYKVIVAVIMTALSFVVFLVRTDMKRAAAVAKDTVLLILPYLTALVVSMPLWVFGVQRKNLITRGISSQIYAMAAVTAMAGIIYVFGKKGFWLNLASMVTANLLTIVEVIRNNGFHAYWEELKTLLLTFSGETGALMKAVEIHELTFAIGLCLLFCMINWKMVLRVPSVWIVLAPAIFCYLSGFKRIGIFAMALSALAALALVLMTGGRKKGRFWPVLFAWLVIVMMFVYLCLVKGGIYEFLSEHFNLDTMGRRELSQYINEYYWIGPDYLGNGTGFVSRLFYDLPERFTIRALHNDILTIYIDLGFWGFWLWMIFYMPFRTWVLCGRQDLKGGISACCCGLFLLLTAMTDNTIYYPYVTSALAITVMGYQEENPG